MANTDNAIGFVPIRHQKGGEMRMGQYSIASAYASAIAAGDVVELTGTGRNIALAAAENVDNLGVFAGVHYVDAQGMPQFSEYWPAGTVATNIVALVWDDPGIVFRVQCNSLAEGAVGALADWDAGTSSATTRRSGLELVGGTTATTGKSMRILGLSNIPDNAYGAYAKADVVFAEHIHLTGAAGAGGV